MYINSVTIVGRLTDKPKLKKSINNNQYVAFVVLLHKPAPIPTETGYENAIRVPDPIPVECIAWGKVAEDLAVTGEKNALVVVEGSIDFRSYFDKEGIRRTNNYVVCKQYMYLDRPYDALEKKWRAKYSKYILKEAQKEARRDRRKRIKEIERACEE